ncbi:MAG: VWA domain-containing protein [Nitrospinota bacterium]
MKFHNINWLWVAILTPLIALLIWHTFRRLILSLESKFTPELLHQLIRPNYIASKALGLFLIAITISIISIALARVQYGVIKTEATSEGIDIVLALDSSNSMRSQDIHPNRFLRAKEEMNLLLNELGGNRFGFVLFADKAVIECPLTADTMALKSFIAAASVGDINEQGTNIYSAIKSSVELLENSKSKTKIILLFSDGEDLSGSINDSIKLAKSHNIQIFTLGIGSTEGAYIPGIDYTDKEPRYIVDLRGRKVISRLDMKSLIHLSTKTSGQAFLADNKAMNIGKLTKQIAKLERSKFMSVEVIEYKERFQLFIILAIVTLTIELLVQLGLSFVGEASSRKET